MAASFSAPCPKSSYSASFGIEPAPCQNRHHQLKLSKISYNPPLDSIPSSLVSGSSSHASAFLRFQKHDGRKHSLWKVWSQRKEVGGDKYLNSPPALETAKTLSEEKDACLEKSDSENAIQDGSSISAFMTQVGDIVRLVDSLEDVAELHLKQQGCEVIIKKKEALQSPPLQSAAVSYSPPPPSSPYPGSSPASSPATPRALPSPPPEAAAKSSHPLLKSPMAGTFYRAPSPGAPAFVKEGDKVEKGQAVCIIEAMKLMNEIEADQSGTIVKILAQDGKSVAIDTPLFQISP